MMNYELNETVMQHVVSLAMEVPNEASLQFVVNERANFALELANNVGIDMQILPLHQPLDYREEFPPIVLVQPAVSNIPNDDCNSLYEDHMPPRSRRIAVAPTTAETSFSSSQAPQEMNHFRHFRRQGRPLSRIAEEVGDANVRTAERTHGCCSLFLHLLSLISCFPKCGHNESGFKLSARNKQKLKLLVSSSIYNKATTCLPGIEQAVSDVLECQGIIYAHNILAMYHHVNRNQPSFISWLMSSSPIGELDAHFCCAALEKYEAVFARATT